MEVSVEKQEDIARKITVTVEAAVFDKAIQTELVAYAKNAKLPGFRKGKIPQKMLEQQFGTSALKDGVDKLINEHYPKALQQEKIVPASLLSITPTQVERGKDFIFDVAIEVYPDVDVPTLTGVEIEQFDVEVKQEDIDQTLKNIQKRKIEYSAKDKKATKGDQVTIDFTGSIEGTTFNGGSAEDTQLVLGEGKFMKEFESNLKGAKKGDEVSFEVAFPEDYHGTEVAGKTAQFDVKVKQVAVGKTPEIDEAFAKEMGIDGGLDAMHAEVKIGLEREMKQKQRGKTRDQIMQALAKTADFPIPKAPVEEEIDRAMKEVSQQLEQQGLPGASKDLIKRENYETQSKERVKLGLLVRAVVEAEKLEPSDEQIEEHVRELASSYSEPDQYVQYVLNDEQQRNQVTGVVIEQQVIDYLLSTAKIKKVKKSYEDFMTSE